MLRRHFYVNSPAQEEMVACFDPPRLSVAMKGSAGLVIKSFHSSPHWLSGNLSALLNVGAAGMMSRQGDGI